MGATNISALTVPSAAPNEFTQPMLVKTYDIDFLTAAYVGITTQAKHNLAPIPLGYALAYLEVVVLTAFTGTGATLTFSLTCDSVTDDLTGAVAITELTKGDMVKGVWAPTTTSSIKCYAHTAAGTIDVTVGTADVTAGRILLICGFRPVAKFITNG